MKRIVRLPNCRSCRASVIAARRSFTPEKTAESATKRAPAFSARKPGQRCFASAGRAPENQGGKVARAVDQPAQDSAFADEVALAHKLRQRTRPHALRERGRGVDRLMLGRFAKKISCG